MSTHTKDDRRVIDTRGDPVHVVADPITEQAHATTDKTSQQVQDSMIQLVRQGLDTSLKSVQVWADLARQVGSTALASPASATMASRAHDPFELLLAAQRKVVGELVATQRHITRQVVDTCAGNDLAPR
ncbi:MAG TPA: hypothetical protein VJT72_05320 [Pseudonocardiaceae bacterium]|nr:hypothetical protein [Pseudonocardiaceae bacterium]